MKPIATINGTSPLAFRLRTITAEDIEVLRNWKNEHRQFFFHKEIITWEQQQVWYARWSREVHDHLFVIESENQRVGCIGTRLFQETADVYNVILGNKTFGGKGIMAEALLATVAFSQLLYAGLPVCVRVLQTNPAIGWYERNGFNRIADNEEYTTMKWMHKGSHAYSCELKLSIPFR